ncbi:hypothetical protein [Erwinia tasmaniensis]
MLTKRIKSFLYPYLYRRQDINLQKQDAIIKKHDEMFQSLEKLKIYIDYQKDEINKKTEHLCSVNSQLIINQMTVQNAQLTNEVAILKNTLNALSRKVRNRSEVIHCLFLVHNVSAWDSLSPVYEAMLKDNAFQPVVASINKKFPGDISFSGEEIVDKKLSQLDIKHIRLKSENSYEDLEIIKTINPDVIFRQSQWDADIPPAFSSEELNFAQLAYVPYEIMNFLGNVDPNIENSQFHKNCSMLFVANKYAYDSLKSNTSINDDHIYMTGHPKVEKLLASESEWPIDWPDERRNYRVIWGAHHSIEHNWSNFGTFMTVYPQMLDWAKKNSQVDIVFSPHPALLTTLLSEKYDSVRQGIEDFFKQWDELPNTSLFTNDTYGPLFQASDALIVDGISWLLEYQILDKPVIFIERDDHLPFLPSGDIIAEGVYRVAGFNDAVKYIEDLMTTSEDSLKQQRKNTLSELAHIKNASVNILKVIKENLR